MCRVVVVGLFCLFAAKASYSQEVFGEPNVWFFQLTTYNLNEKWTVGNELHARFDDYLNDPQQILIRPFFTYHTGNSFALSGGYTFITTYPYGAFPLPENLPEHNVWEQAELKQVFNKTKVLHRYRLEQRWIGNLMLNPENKEFEVDGYNLRHRFRYRLTAMVDLSDKVFLHFFDELFIRSGEDFKQVGFDRNWFSSGLGFRFNERVNLQLAYLHQYIRRTNELFEEHHSILATAVISLSK
ncbi:MAG: DUF2490 domain-containing protein [Cryomorphaceae bacterium]